MSRLIGDDDGPRRRARSLRVFVISFRLMEGIEANELLLLLHFLSTAHAWRPTDWQGSLSRISLDHCNGLSILHESLCWVCAVVVRFSSIRVESTLKSLYSIFSPYPECRRHSALCLLPACLLLLLLLPRHVNTIHHVLSARMLFLILYSAPTHPIFRLV